MLKSIYDKPLVDHTEIDLKRRQRYKIFGYRQLFEQSNIDKKSESIKILGPSKTKKIE
jgi:hypothetical protein